MESNTIDNFVMHPGHAWDWAMDFVKVGDYRSIRRVANQIKDKFYTDGIWSQVQQAKLAYDMLLEAAEMAKCERAV